MIIDSRSWQTKLYKGHVPFAWFLLFCILGVLLSTYVTPGPSWFLGLKILSVLLFLTCLACFRLPAFFGFFFLLFLSCLCWMRAWEGNPNVNPMHFSHHGSGFLFGFVADEPRENEKYTRFRLQVTGGGNAESERVLTLNGSIQITAERGLKLSYGDLIVIPGDQYMTVAPPRNPGEMDYAAHLAKQNCWHQAYLGEGQIRLLEGRGGQALTAFALATRKGMVDKFGRFVPDKDAFSIASTLILGYRADLSPELMEVFSITGTIHVLSVSGMHVVIVFWLLAKLLFWMDRQKSLKILRFPLLLLAIWAYAFLTGFSPSVLRAAMMLGFVLWAEAWGRHSRTYNNIAASAFFLMLSDPKLLLDIGFQLSYLAVAGIVFLYPLLQKLYRVRHRFLKPVADYSMMSVAAQAGAFPLAMYYFQQFPVYFLLANLLIVLPASAIMYLGFALLLLPETTVTGFWLRMLGQLLSGLIVWMNRALAWIQGLPAASLTGLETSAWQCLLIYLLILSLIFAILRRSKVLFGSFLLIAICLTLLAAIPFYQKWSQRTLIVHQVRSAMAISYTGRGQAWIYSDLPDRDHNTVRFSLLPYLRTFVSPGKIQWIASDSSFDDGWTMISGGFLQIGEKRVYIYDREDQPVPAPLKVDLLLIRKNPRKPLSEILARYPSPVILLDGSNHGWTIERLEKEAMEAGLAYYVLKDNFAYVWLLDE